jgi:hypothetical protein
MAGATPYVRFGDRPVLGFLLALLVFAKLKPARPEALEAES